MFYFSGFPSQCYQPLGHHCTALKAPKSKRQITNNSKHEARNLFESEAIRAEWPKQIQMFKSSKFKTILRIWILDFEFVSYFDIRISNLFVTWVLGFDISSAMHWWVSPFGHPRIKVCYATPRGLSQLRHVLHRPFESRHPPTALNVHKSTKTTMRGFTLIENNADQRGWILSAEICVAICVNLRNMCVLTNRILYLGNSFRTAISN